MPHQVANRISNLLTIDYKVIAIFENKGVFQDSLATQLSIKAIVKTTVGSAVESSPKRKVLAGTSLADFQAGLRHRALGYHVIIQNLLISFKLTSSLSASVETISVRASRTYFSTHIGSCYYEGGYIEYMTWCQPYVILVKRLLRVHTQCLKREYRWEFVVWLQLSILHPNNTKLGKFGNFRSL